MSIVIGESKVAAKFGALRHSEGLPIGCDGQQDLA
jgi:hypothetical protein